MKKAIKRLTLITAVMMMFSLFGCGKDARFMIETYKNAEKNTMLLDCFERTVGTPEEQPYEELVLYTYSDSQALLEVYAEGGTPDETVTRYLVPIEAAQEMLSAVKDSGMDRWNSLTDADALDGRQFVCKFPDGKGGYTRVSSDHMPADGARVFGTVKAAMRRFLIEEYREEEGERIE